LRTCQSCKIQMIRNIASEALYSMFNLNKKQ
jgi:hypothetical protein